MMGDGASSLLPHGVAGASMPPIPREEFGWECQIFLSGPAKTPDVKWGKCHIDADICSYGNEGCHNDHDRRKNPIQFSPCSHPSNGTQNSNRKRPCGRSKASQSETRLQKPSEKLAYPITSQAVAAVVGLAEILQVEDPRRCHKDPVARPEEEQKVSAPRLQ